MSAPTPGRWPVVLSGRAIRELRLLSEDKRTLEIIRTKLKYISCLFRVAAPFLIPYLRELSHGQFTTDNCLPIRGTRENIPIYRARLSNDLRIVYLIDLVSDAHNQVRILLYSAQAYTQLLKSSSSLIIKVSQGGKMGNCLFTADTMLSSDQGLLRVLSSSCCL